VLAPDEFNSPGYAENLEMFCRGVRQNAIIVSDDSGILLRALVDAIATVPPKYQQRVQAWFEETLRTSGPRRVRCTLPNPDPDLTKLAAQLRQATGADALITSQKGVEALTTHGVMEPHVLLMSDYIDSSFEAQRDAFAKGLPPLDKVKPVDFEPVIARVVRFSQWLRIFDKQIGKGNDTHRFVAGLRFLIDVWMRTSFYGVSGLQHLTIVTGTSKSVYPGMDYHQRSKIRAQNRSAITILASTLVAPLQAVLPCPVRLIVKEDPDKIFHVRLLESDQAVVAFDRGFDLFAKSGARFLRNVVYAPGAGASIAADILALPDAP
jgi:hypothetical protein